jgi:hypothetical protein
MLPKKFARDVGLQLEQCWEDLTMWPNDYSGWLVQTP